PPLSTHQPLEGLQSVRFANGLVPTDAVDARETHRHTRAVASRAVHAVERDFEHDLGLDLAHRPPSLDGLIAHPLVEAAQFLAGNAGVGVADGLLLVAAPGAEGVVGIEGRAVAVAALRVHQPRVESQCAALPFDPRSLRAAGDIERIRALQHQPLDTAL